MTIKIIAIIFLSALIPGNAGLKGQTRPISMEVLVAAPPMGWMSRDNFGKNINERECREMADAMINSGMSEAGYKYFFIDDGWQGGRDNRNNMIADPNKFPSGIKALADYLHSKGLKLGIYSGASQLSCAGYTASLGFEEQDAKTFAGWGVDYLKYEYCDATADSTTAVVRFKKMGTALRKSGRDIAFSICGGGDLKPWHWAAEAGGQLWRTTADVGDKWQGKHQAYTVDASVKAGAGILDVADFNGGLAAYAKQGAWNDMGVLMIGSSGRNGSPGSLVSGCSDTEYQSQMSLWSMMASPLTATNDVRNMNALTRRILLNEEIIAISQDALGKQAERRIDNTDWSVFVKPLSNGDYAVAILNRSAETKSYSINWTKLGLTEQFVIRDVWQKQFIGKGRRWKGKILGHETRVFRLKKV